MGRWIRIKLALNIHIYKFFSLCFHINIFMYFLGERLSPFAAGAEGRWGTMVPTLGTESHGWRCPLSQPSPNREGEHLWEAPAGFKA